jgi:hypothetical protein
MNSDEKLDAILKLIQNLITPMTKTLDEMKKSSDEISKSTSSRYIVLISMTIIAFFVFGSQIFVINKMNNVISRIDEVSIQSNINSVQFEDLAKVTRDYTSSPEVEKKINDMLMANKYPSKYQISRMMKSFRKPKSQLVQRILNAELLDSITDK